MIILRCILIAITITILIVNMRMADFGSGWRVQLLFTLYLLYLLIN